MTKAEFISQIAKKANVNEATAQDILRETFALLKSFPDHDESVTLKGFGKFYTRNYQARKGRNPITGEAIAIPARSVLTLYIFCSGFKFFIFVSDSISPPQ